MKNLILLGVILGCVGLIIFGVINKNKEKIDNSSFNNVVIDNSNEERKLLTQEDVLDKIDVLSNDENIVSPTKSIKNNEVKKFYPDNTSSIKIDNVVSDDDGRNFQITPELIGKLYLVDKYNPGICYGIAVTPLSSSINMVLTNQKDLANFLRQKYNLTSDLEVYNKIKQINGIELKLISSSNFSYTFMDGQCATLIYHQGRVSVSGDRVEDTLISRESHTNN